MSVIITKYLPATYARGARIKASLARGWGGTLAPKPLTVAWDHSLSGWENHLRVAKEYASVCGLPGNYLTVDAGESGYTFARETAVSPGFTVTTNDFLTIEEAEELLESLA